MAERVHSGAIELTPVDLRHFAAGRAPHVDLYRPMDGRPMLCCKASAIFTAAARYRLLGANVRQLYVRFVDGVVQAGGSALSTLLSLPDDELAPDVKAALIYTSAISTARLVFLTPGTPRHIDVAMDVVGAIAHQIAHDPAYVSGLTLTMRNDTVYSHSVNVCIYATALAHYYGVEGTELATLGMAAFLHDIGKTRVPDSILDKPGGLDTEEWKTIRKHPELGLEVLGSQAGRLAPEVRAAVLAHHERLDGSGYPQGLADADICWAARVVAVADVYDALTSDRPYRSRLSPAAALRIVREEMAGKLDGAVFDRIVRMLGEPAARPGRLHHQLAAEAKVARIA
jgi:putative nucleotidyltransferase with HDIG domain